MRALWQTLSSQEIPFELTDTLQVDSQCIWTQADILQASGYPPSRHTPLSKFKGALFQSADTLRACRHNSSRQPFRASRYPPNLYSSRWPFGLVNRQVDCPVFFVYGRGEGIIIISVQIIMLTKGWLNPVRISCNLVALVFFKDDVCWGFTAGSLFTLIFKILSFFWSNGENWEEWGCLKYYR